MKRSYILGIILVCFIAVTGSVRAQETFTGNVISYGSRAYTGVRTANFTLKINRSTPDEKANGFLEMLQSNGQDALLNAVRNEDLGSFSLNQGLSRTINAVRETNEYGKRHIYVVFERWEQFNEIRSGRRSLDYPFGYIELVIDSRTGKGTGQYFAAAKIRWKKVEAQVEIEDYATFPAKLVNVESNRGRP